MMTAVCVFAIALLFCAVYLLMMLFRDDRPRCPRCDHAMKYIGEDESGREVWVCQYCGERVML